MKIWDRLATIAATVAVTSMVWIVLGPQLLEKYAQSPTNAPNGAAGGAVPGTPPLRSAATPLVAAGGSQLVIPVKGVTSEQLVDTFSQSRAAASRRHDAIDIPAPRGTEVVAVAPGTVEKLFLSQPGGITVYIRSLDGKRMHYYAHLERYAPGLAEGQTVTAGQPIGAVGSTGNADPAAPHLHYAIAELAPGEKWWQGTPLNPYPLLKLARPAAPAAVRTPSSSTALP